MFRSEQISLIFYSFACAIYAPKRIGLHATESLQTRQKENIQYFQWNQWSKWSCDKCDNIHDMATRYRNGSCTNEANESNCHKILHEIRSLNGVDQNLVIITKSSSSIQIQWKPCNEKNTPVCTPKWLAEWSQWTDEICEIWHGWMCGEFLRIESNPFPAHYTSTTPSKRKTSRPTYTMIYEYLRLKTTEIPTPDCYRKVYPPKMIRKRDCDISGGAFCQGDMQYEWGEWCSQNDPAKYSTLPTAECINQDGGWSEWNPSVCSVTCGNGTRTRTRQCNNPPVQGSGADCPGASSITEGCEIDVPCPIPGGWGNWSEWQCDSICQNVYRPLCCTYFFEARRIRKCDNPTPKYGGDECDGNNTETKVEPSLCRCTAPVSLTPFLEGFFELRQQIYQLEAPVNSLIKTKCKPQFLDELTINLRLHGKQMTSVQLGHGWKTKTVWVWKFNGKTLYDSEQDTGVTTFKPGQKFYFRNNRMWMFSPQLSDSGIYSAHLKYTDFDDKFLCIYAVRITNEDEEMYDMDVVAGDDETNQTDTKEYQCNADYLKTQRFPFSSEVKLQWFHNDIRQPNDTQDETNIQLKPGNTGTWECRISLSFKGPVRVGTFKTKIKVSPPLTAAEKLVLNLKYWGSASFCVLLSVIALPCMVLWKQRKKRARKTDQ